jgi:putative membrane protein
VLTGQMVGGLITWVPAAVIESVGALLALRVWLRLSRAGRLPKRAPSPLLAAPPSGVVSH